MEVGLSKKGSEEVRPVWRLNPKKLLEKGSEEADKRNNPPSSNYSLPREDNPDSASTGVEPTPRSRASSTYKIPNPTVW